MTQVAHFEWIAHDFSVGVNDSESISGLLWDDLRATLGRSLGYFGTISGLLWGDLRATLG